MNLTDKDEKRYLEEFRRSQTLTNILSLLSTNGVLSIAELGRKLNINNSTMRYYISLLKQEGQITSERREDLQHRPTLIKLNEEYFKAYKEDMKKKVEEYREKMENSKLKEKILSLLKEKPLSAIEISEMLRNQDPNLNAISDILSMLNYLELHGKVKNEWKLLKENDLEGSKK